MKRLAEQKQSVKAKKSFGRWFRFYVEAIDDPKVQALPGHLFKFWVNILCLAAKSNGELPSNSDVAFACRVCEAEAEDMVSQLIGRGLIDVLNAGSDHIITPHNWTSRQFRWDGKDLTNADRQKRSRERKKKSADSGDNAIVTVGITVGVTENPSVSESESSLPCQEEDSEVEAGDYVKAGDWPTRLRCSGAAGCGGWPCSACVETMEVAR